MLNYLSEEQQRTKFNDAYKTYSDILYGVQQRSILGSLLFNIDISDTFYDINKCDIASYTDDNTPYTSDFNLVEIIQEVELITKNLFEWIKKTHESQHWQVSPTKGTDVTTKTGESDVKNSREKNFLVLK